MAGLSLVLEGQRGISKFGGGSGTTIIVDKVTVLKKNIMMITAKPLSGGASDHLRFPTSVANFLESCFLCREKLLPGKDIYMYKGDRAFCSIDCRCQQIQMDEDEVKVRKVRERKNNCSLAAIKNRNIAHIQSTLAPLATTPSSSPKPHQSRLHYPCRGVGHRGLV